MDHLWQDLRFTLRSLASQPGFTAVAVITLALGIGASSAIFSVVNAVLLKPLPLDEPDRLMALQGSAMVMTPTELRYLREASKTIGEWAAMDMMDFNLVDDGGPTRVASAMVSPGFFETFGVRPALGRGFAPEEGEPGRNDVALISHQLWSNRYGAREDMVGRQIEVHLSATFGPKRPVGSSLTVIGVLPPDFHGPRQPRDIWVPTHFDTPDTADASYLFLFARLAAEASPESATSELNGIYGAIPRPSETDREIRLVPMTESVVQSVRPAILAVTGAVAFVLLIACVNVAHLLLARGLVRQREMAVRLSLGASRSRLVRQLLVESLALASLGGVLALVIARGGVMVLRAWHANAVPRLPEIHIEGNVLLFTLVLTLLTAMLFGLLPAFRSSDLNLSSALRSGGGLSGSRSRVRQGLVVAEVALAVVLLVGAGLLVRSFQRLLDVDLGFRGEGVLSFGVALPQMKYGGNEERQVFFQEALEQLAALPDVESAGATSILPFSFHGSARGFAIEGRPSSDGESTWAHFRKASADYFQTMEIPLLAGESFQEADVLAEPSVMMINRAMARRFWEEDDPIGSSVTVEGFEDPLRVIGVVGDTKSFATSDIFPKFYLPSLANPVMGFVVRGRAEPEALTEQVRRTILEIDPLQAIHEVQALDLRGRSRLTSRRFNALLVTLLAGLALVLTAVGIFGVLSFSVSQRTREMGVRMAIGAQRADVLRMVISQGLRLVAVGLAIGLAASLGLTRFLESLLFGVTTTDPTTFVLISAVLLTVSLLAVYVPARRATRVEPVTALRHE